ncbi:MAG: hypothetical protein IE913_02995 [Halothiobacillus sp.]|nr:hypothetical protein [Halothiobacillus sp.]
MESNKAANKTLQSQISVLLLLPLLLVLLTHPQWLMLIFLIGVPVGVLVLSVGYLVWYFWRGIFR